MEADQKLLLACKLARFALQVVVADERSQKAGLWRGQFLPRVIRQLEEAIEDVEDPVGVAHSDG